MLEQKSSYSVIRREERRDEENRYMYELIMRKGDTLACWQMPLYSIRVNMIDAFGNEGSAYVTDVFSDENKALNFFDKLVRNLATPIDLSYILEDEIS